MNVAHLERNLQTDTWEWDTNLCAVFGMGPGTFIPSEPALLAIKHPDDLATSRTMAHLVRGGGSHFSYSHRIFRDDGHTRLINSEALVTPNSKGIPGMMHATVDVMGDWILPLGANELPAATEGELMLGLRAQLPDALTEVFRRHDNGVARSAQKYLSGSFNVEDIVQDVFEGLFRAPERFDARRGSLSTYLAMRAQARCIDVMRSQGSRLQREVGSAPVCAVAIEVEDEALLDLTRRDVRSALAQLARPERVPIELAYFGGMSYRAVADHLGIPEGTVKSRIRSGLRRLQLSLAKADTVVSS